MHFLSFVHIHVMKLKVFVFLISEDQRCVGFQCFFFFLIFYEYFSLRNIIHVLSINCSLSFIVCFTFIFSVLVLETCLHPYYRFQSQSRYLGNYLKCIFLTICSFKSLSCLLSPFVYCSTELGISRYAQFISYYIFLATQGDTKYTVAVFSFSGNCYMSTTYSFLLIKKIKEYTTGYLETAQQTASVARSYVAQQ